jgi:SAM-dependent methyltransferase
MTGGHAAEDLGQAPLASRSGQVYANKQHWDRFLDELPITGHVLELACGTGHWTPLLAARARSVTAIDAAPEMLVVARQRVTGLPVELVVADVFGWRPPRRYDTVFFGFWLAHVPPARLPPSGLRSLRHWPRTAAPASWRPATGPEPANICWSTSRSRPLRAALATAAATG